MTTRSGDITFVYIISGSSKPEQQTKQRRQKTKDWTNWTPRPKLHTVFQIRSASYKRVEKTDRIQDAGA